MNPRLVKVLAPTLIHLANEGLQIFVATHSLFFIREWMIANKAAAHQVDTRYIGLQPGDNGIEVHQGQDVLDSMPIAALEEGNRQASQ